MKNHSRKMTWNERYRSKQSVKEAPSQFLLEHLSLLKTGSVLDLASGQGRNAIWLAENGFQVTAVDFSDVALKYIAKISLQKKLGISTIELDLENPDKFEELKGFDNAIVINFKANTDLLQAIPHLLTDQGILLYTTFNQLQNVQYGFNAKYCLHQGELVGLDWNMTLIEYRRYREGPDNFDGYIFQKTGNP